MPRTRPTRRAVLAVAISPHTVFDVTMYEPTAPERRATGYVSWALGEMEPAQLEGPGWIGAPGGIWSTAGDIAKWDLALMRPGFLTPASRAARPKPSPARARWPARANAWRG